MSGPSAMAGPPRRPARAAWALLVGVAFVMAATAVRGALGLALPDLSAFGLYYPAVLTAGLLGGWVGAATALIASLLLGAFYFADGGFAHPSPSAIANLLIFAVSGALVGFVGARLDSLLYRRRIGLARLAERELRYRTLFESVSDGFALVRAVRDDTGRLIDYVVIEANPALLRMFGLEGSVVGRRQSEILTHTSASWLEACDEALAGRPITLEYAAGHRWFEVHLSRVGEEELAQFIVEVTARKIAEARQHELFDELNHRVKNNLAMVSAMLAMQARAAAEPTVRADLEKAVDRIQTIADVHTALYRSSSKDEVDFAAYLHDLCERLSASLLADERVRLVMTAEQISLPLDRAVALGVVVNELVTNAAKHAYPPPTPGVIEVALRHTPEGLALSVADQGRGVPECPSGGQGLGMRLIRSLVQQLDGHLHVRRGGGACFVITAPHASMTPLAPPSQSRLL